MNGSRESSVVTIDPATGAPFARYEQTTPEEVDRLLSRASAEAGRWRQCGVDERATALAALADALRDRCTELALLATREMGKPISEARAEVEKCAWCCDWYAEFGPAMLEHDVIATEARRSYVAFQPLGVVFAIMPWNFPYWQVVRAVAPALLAGNAVVLKHAPATTGCALRLVEVAAFAGLPDGLFSVIVASAARSPGLAARVVEDERVAAVTLTGSSGAGRAVAAVAGSALKKAVLELGGSDPFVVLEGADLDAAAEWAVRSRFQNAGQSCIAAKRIIVDDRVADAFVERLLRRVAELRLGDPRDPTVTLGPLAREDLRDVLARQVAESVNLGARVLAGGRIPNRPGFFYEPTVLDRVPTGAAVLTEEVFGPAVPVVRADDAASAITLANETPYGLGSNIWSSDVAEAAELALGVRAGNTAINGITTSDPRLPFGGVKGSGYGRELARYGLHEFVNAHTIVVNEPSGPGSTRPVVE